MKPIEQVLAAFEFESTDKVPIHHIGFFKQCGIIYSWAGS